jgi:LAS superfamily LD-carboxypeptidase LdcB
VVQRSSTAARWFSLILTTATGLFVASSVEALNVQRLEPTELEQLTAILRTLDPVIAPKKQDGTAILLTWDELYAPLTPDQRAFLDAFRAIQAKPLGATSHHFGEPAQPPALVPVGIERILKDGVPAPLDPQYLPADVLEAYQRMMAAMEHDLGRRLFVESGYRSPAYQLYLFMFYLPKHEYSITETNRFVALPGHSEHGYPPRQAIDFINREGISGEDHPEAFEALPEYHWLLEHAKHFDFVLSYPRDNPDHTAFEPWHWHYEGP